MTIRPCLFLCLFLTAVPPLPAQEAATAERIDLVVERLEDLAEEHHVPGMGLAVVTPEGVFTRGIGLADRESERAATPKTLFEIGSTTKTFTAVLIETLVEGGEMDLDVSVREYVPYFHLKNPDADAEVAVRDLLSHRTGITRTDVLLGGGEAVSEEDIARQLALAEPMAPFRQNFLYNNQMFMVAGLAAEAAGQASYAELLEERVFGPLGMERSTATLAEALADEEMSTGYRWLEVEEELEVVPTRGIARSAPAGAILSCPEDMAFYLSFLLARGALDDGESLLSAEAFAEGLWKQHIAISQTEGYGLGFMIGKWRDKTLVHHGGNVDGFTSQMALLPDEGIGFSLLMNMSLSAVQQKSVDAVFESLLGGPAEAEAPAAAAAEAGPAPFTAEELEVFAGDYDFAEAKQIWTVLVKDNGRLALDVPGQHVYELLWPDERGRWAFLLAPQVQVSFQREGSGAVETLTMYQGPAEILMPRKAAPEGLPTVEEVLALLDGALDPAVLAAACPLLLGGSVHLVHQGVQGRFLMRYQDGSHWRLDLDFGKFGSITTVINGDSGWSFVPLRGRQELSVTERAEAQRGAPFSSLSQNRDFYREFRVIDVVGEGDEARTLLRVFPIHGRAATLHIDAAGNVRREEAAISIGELGGIPVTTTFEDYREENGLNLAHRVAMQNPMTGVNRMVTDNVETGVAIDPGIWQGE